MYARRVRWCFTVVFASAAVMQAAVSSKPSFNTTDVPSAAILLALQEGVDGDVVLTEWSDTLSSLHEHQRPLVWVLCSEDNQRESAVKTLPHVLPLVIGADASWTSVVETLSSLSAKAAVVGLLSEGVVPSPDLDKDVETLAHALSLTTTPTAVLARSRSRRTDGVENAWLPDSFIAQVWCSEAVLTGLGLEEATVKDWTMLEILPEVMRTNREVVDMDVVDGTSVITSLYHVGGRGVPLLEKKDAGGEHERAVSIGSLDLAVVLGSEESDEDSTHAQISTAPWPPPYILETVARKNGLIILNSVNCGYLDMATNFLRSVERVSNAKVLWVTFDEVAFKFMDALAPGYATMFPSEGTERHHALKAGSYGDAMFKSQVLVRPRILSHILSQGYALLWTDSDMVWLGNPLSLLPDVNDPGAAELLLQEDGTEDNECTCFLFMQPTPLVEELLQLWMQSIVDENSDEDQKPFHGPLHQQLDKGLRVDVISDDILPTGKKYFAHPHEEGYAETYFPDVRIVHNNWIKGHDRKVERFQDYHLWDVGDFEFPRCERRRY